MSFQEQGEGLLINLRCIDYGSILHHVLLCLYVVASLINKVRKG